MSTVEVVNIGPVEHVTIPVPEGGGIVVLKGRNGAGKSKTLEAVESVVSGRGSLTVRDGALRGEVTAFGARVTVGRSTRRSGELEVVSLEGRLSIADLVDPKIKSPEAADAKRIKSLVQLGGNEPNIADFYKLVGSREEFEKTVGPNALESDDYVLMAERIKRALEAAARRLEDQAENAEGRARGMLDDVRETAVESVLSSDELQKQFEQDVAMLNSLENQDKRYRLEQGRIEEARLKLNGIALVEESDIETEKKVADEFESTVRVIELNIAEAESHLRKLREQLNQHQAKLRESRNRIDALQVQRSQQEALNKALQATVEPVDSRTIEQAREAVAKSREAIERAAIVRRAAEKKLEAEGHVKEAGRLRRQAESLRAAGKDTDLVLSDLVSRFCKQLRVEHGRLVLDTKRGTTYYSELSHGERWKIAIDIATDAVGSNGVIVVPQEAYEGLDTKARKLVSEHAKERGIVLLTAECSDDEEIQAEVFA